MLECDGSFLPHCYCFGRVGVLVKGGGAVAVAVGGDRLSAMD